MCCAAHLRHKAVVAIRQGVGHSAARVPHARAVAEHLAARHPGQKAFFSLIV